MKHYLKVTTVLLTLSSLSASAAVYSSGHADIGVEYENGELEPHWHLHAPAIVDGVALANSTEYEPDELLAQVSTTRNSPFGLESALGVSDGTTVFVMGSAAYQPNLGFGVEELDFSDWTGGITLHLTNWEASVPGANVALYTTNLSGDSVIDIIMSSKDPSTTVFDNSLPMVPGDHVHLQWAFTDPGTYLLEFTWNATHNLDGPVSASDTFTFQVIPEPSAAGLSVVAALGLCIRRKRA